jgi:mRNA degradation ribonuclease J1/J2
MDMMFRIPVSVYGSKVERLELVFDTANENRAPVVAGSNQEYVHCITRAKSLVLFEVY